MLRCVALVRTDVSEKCSASVFRATRIGEQGTTLPATSNLSELQRNTKSEEKLSLPSTVFLHGMRQLLVIDNVPSWRMMSSGMLCRVALVITDVSEELSAFFIRVRRIGELGTTLAATSNRRTLRRNTKWERKLEWNSKLRMQRGWRGKKDNS
jgi:hypothetical protein